MDREQFTGHLNAVLTKLNNTLGAKSADYSGDADVYNNLRLCEAFGITSVERGIFVRMLDKIGRIANLFERERVMVKDESMEDTVLDLAGYAILLYIWLNRNNQQPSEYKTCP